MKDLLDLLDLLDSVFNLTNLTNQYNSLITTCRIYIAMTPNVQKRLQMFKNDSKCSKATPNVQKRLQMFKTDVSLILFHHTTEMTA